MKLFKVSYAGGTRFSIVAAGSFNAAMSKFSKAMRDELDKDERDITAISISCEREVSAGVWD